MWSVVHLILMYVPWSELSIKVLKKKVESSSGRVCILQVSKWNIYQLDMDHMSNYLSPYPDIYHVHFAKPWKFFRVLEEFYIKILHIHWYCRHCPPPSHPSWTDNRPSYQMIMIEESCKHNIRSPRCVIKQQIELQQSYNNDIYCDCC